MRRFHLITLGKKNHATERYTKDQLWVTPFCDCFRIADKPGVYRVVA